MNNPDMNSALFKSKNRNLELWCASLISCLAMTLMFSSPSWAQSFEALGKWDSSYGKTIIKYAGTKPDGTEAITGRWIYDKQKKQIGKITKGVYNRKKGTLWFDFLEPWSSTSGRATFVLSKDRTKMKGSYKYTDGSVGEWDLTRPVAQSMIVYIPGQTIIEDVGDEDVIIKVGGKKVVYVEGDTKIVKVPGKTVRVVGGGNASGNAGDAHGGGGGNAGAGDGSNGKLQSQDVPGAVETHLVVVNKSGGPIRVNWVDQSGKEGKSEDIIESGQKKDIGSTYTGHVYRARDAKWNSLLSEVRVPKTKDGTFKFVIQGSGGAEGLEKPMF